MHIGLIGDIGPAATDFYSRRLITTFAGANTPLELTLVHADALTLLRHLAANHAKPQVASYQRLTRGLASAGADYDVVTSIAGHFCIGNFTAESPLPVVDRLAEVSRVVERRDLLRIGMPGTRTVMESRFYGGITSPEIIPPDGPELEAVHEAYGSMATSGFVTDAQTSVFTAASRRLITEHCAEAIMLRGTDLARAFNEQTAGFPLVDCAPIHVDAITRLAKL